MPSDVALVEDVLEFIGVFVSLSIAYISFRGLRETESPSMLRLATAFSFLGFGFLVEAIVGLGGAVETSPGAATTAIAALVVAGPLMETVGYFFLAFSHAVDVIFAKRLGAAMLAFPAISLSVTQATDALGILSFYFIVYGVVETLYAYAHRRNPETLVTAVGLALLGMGTFVPLLSLLYPGVYLLSLVQIIFKEVGLMILFVPVLNFALGGRRLIGPV